MNTIQLAKEQAKTLLEAGGLRAFEYVPERIPTNAVVMTAGEPFITGSNLFGHHTIRLDLTCIATVASNIKSTGELDELVCNTVIALSGWNLERVSQPFQLAANGTTYLAARVEISTDIKIEIEPEGSEGD